MRNRQALLKIAWRCWIGQIMSDSKQWRRRRKWHRIRGEEIKRARGNYRFRNRWGEQNSGRGIYRDTK